MDALRVLLAPIISEKSMNEAALGRYTFKVSKDANKEDIKKAVEEKFKVNVLKTSTAIVKGRKKIAGARRIQVLQGPFKKAVVTVRQGQKISIFDSGAQK